MAQQGFFEEHYTDEDGNPEGGVAFGKGFTISFQRGPLGRIGTVTRKEPNGAFVEDIIAAAIGRIQFYQDGKFACPENAEALSHLKLALKELEARTSRRVAAKTEGTHEGD